MGLDNDAINPHPIFLRSLTALTSEGEDAISRGGTHQGPCQRSRRGD